MREDDAWMQDADAPLSGQQQPLSQESEYELQKTVATAQNEQTLIRLGLVQESGNNHLRDGRRAQEELARRGVPVRDLHGIAVRGEDARGQDVQLSRERLRQQQADDARDAGFSSEYDSEDGNIDDFLRQIC